MANPISNNKLAKPINNDKLTHFKPKGKTKTTKNRNTRPEQKSSGTYEQKKNT